MIIKEVRNPGVRDGSRITVRCPKCGRDGTFEPIGKAVPDGINEFGQSRCPNPSCRGHVFYIIESGKLIVTYPQQLIDFDKTNVPEKVLEAMEEAWSSHANDCYIAAAIMLRKTLEEICKDKNAKGDNLQKRIASLSSKIVIPKELIEGMDELRLLGNDAAHVDAGVYNEIGKDEIETAIEFTKEIIKAVYQLENLLKKLKALKKEEQ